MRQLFIIYLRAFKNAFAAKVAYRADFIIGFFFNFIIESILPFVLFLIYKSGSSFPGWSFYEVLLLQSIFLLAKGITFPFVSGVVWNTLVRVREGNYDLILTKPCSSLFLTITTGININDLGKLFTGLSLFIISIGNLKTVSMINWFAFIILFFCAILVFMSFSFIMAATSFKWVGNSRLYEIFDSLTDFGMYPITIYSKSIQWLLTLIIPVALMGYIPASVLLSRSAPGIYLSIFSAVLFFIFSLWFWHRMLKVYTSAGG